MARLLHRLNLVPAAATITMGDVCRPLKEVVSKSLSNSVRLYRVGNGTTIKWKLSGSLWQAHLDNTLLATFSSKPPRKLVLEPIAHRWFDHIVVGVLVLMRETNKAELDDTSSFFPSNSNRNSTYHNPSLLPLLGLVFAQDGSISGPTSSSQAAGYSCDTTKCKLPSCNCASPNPPGGLNASDVPQFLVFTADDAVQSYTLDAVNQFLAQRKNPNGCQPKMTYYTSINYTNYTLVTDWFVAGNEIADHTMTHVGTPPADEVNGNLIALNALAGIPLQSIIGFRAPFLNYTVDTLKLLASVGFTYDSSATASLPVTDPNTDANWPYSLDYGMANDCLEVENICKGEPKLPGFWEVPMYAMFDDLGVNGPHLMDPWLDMANGANVVNDTATLEYMKNTFTAHYTGNRQPFGLYTHPIHVSRTVPGATVTNSTINMINSFIDWAQEQPNVWIVSSEQLLAWVQNPVPISQLDSFEPLKCSTPAVDPSTKICNGIPQNEAGLIDHCAFSDFPFYTCYGCPVEPASPSNPNPPQSTESGQQARFRLPSNCSTPFWDPVKGECICNSSSCAFQDISRPIGPNGANLTGGNDTTYSSATASTSANPYVPFNGALQLPSGVAPALVVGLAGALLGAGAACPPSNVLVDPEIASSLGSLPLMKANHGWSRDMDLLQAFPIQLTGGLSNAHSCTRPMPHIWASGSQKSPCTSQVDQRRLPKLHNQHRTSG
ncbi:hypothetical protein A0H81_01437 [Grifola frondosa]|uniref:Chitin deacetylase n=1 Tax=Grifola frondosa TaxID=5627 RepID=A0A1C7MSV1_GRIFR|nr:hypothetical protein A0H81_01437 [Grifola frondosa]